MPKPAIQVDGLDELRRQLRRVKDSGLDAEMKAIHLELASEVVARALPDVPVKTGALKKSVRAAGTVRDAIGRAGGASVPYAGAVHWGHGAKNLAVIAHGKQRRHRGRKASVANPFLRNAAVALERDITDRYDQQVSKMLNKIVKETV